MSGDDIPEITLTKEEVDRALDELLPITGDLIRQRIIDGVTHFHLISIFGGLTCSKINMSQFIVFSKISMDGSIQFSDTELLGFELRKSVIGGGLRLDHSVINGDLVIDSSSINNLGMNRTIINGNLIICKSSVLRLIELRDTEIKGYIRVMATNGPEEIFVSENMAQRIHFAAPTVPLVVLKNRD